MSVHAFLVTVDPGQKFALWAQSAIYANWIEGRENGSRETWQVMVFDEQAAGFLDAARAVDGVTVEEIEGAGAAERYLLRVGEPGSGWAGRGDSALP